MDKTGTFLLWYDIRQFPPLTLAADESKFARSGESQGMAKTTRRVGVVLFQLGGPDTLAAIEPFLYNLFCDPDIIDFPFARIGRKPLAKLISSTRARKVQHHYATIGGGSPIRRFTEMQARALERVLAESGLEARCFVVEFSVPHDVPSHSRSRGDRSPYRT